MAIQLRVADRNAMNNLITTAVAATIAPFISNATGEVFFSVTNSVSTTTTLRIVSATQVRDLTETQLLRTTSIVNTRTISIVHTGTSMKPFPFTMAVGEAITLTVTFSNVTTFSTREVTSVASVTISSVTGADNTISATIAPTRKGSYIGKFKGTQADGQIFIQQLNLTVI